MEERERHEKPRGFRKVIGFVGEVITEFSRDRCILLAAAIAYFMGLSLPSVLVLIILILGFFVDPQAVRGTLARQLEELIGERGARQVEAMIRNANLLVQGDTLAILLGVGTLLFAATGVFLSMQASLNNVWKVGPDPKQGGVKIMLFKRLLSLLMTLIVAVFLLLSLALSTILTAFGGLMETVLPAGVFSALLQGANWLISLGLSILLFAAVFKILPDADITWRDVWVGSGVTAVLFLIGRAAAGLYLARSNPVSVFGAAGSFVIILLWIYISAIILLFGAEFIQVWIRYHGRSIRPERGAARRRTQTR